MPQYVLPALAYDYGALEPYVAGRVMELHHDKHHAAYVKQANTVLEQIEEAREGNDRARLAGLEQALAFNVSGHVLHSIFWQNMKPKAGGRPMGELATAIDRDFGGFDTLKKQMNETAAGVMGSGWAALIWEPLGGCLLVTQIHDHQSNTTQGGVPLLVIDVWEHAYYLQYANEKAQFFDALWNLWDWEDVSQRYRGARALDVKLAGVAG